MFQKLTKAKKSVKICKKTLGVSGYKKNIWRSLALTFNCGKPALYMLLFGSNINQFILWGLQYPTSWHLTKVKICQIVLTSFMNGLLDFILYLKSTSTVYTVRRPESGYFYFTDNCILCNVFNIYNVRWALYWIFVAS